MKRLVRVRQPDRNDDATRRAASGIGRDLSFGMSFYSSEFPSPVPERHAVLVVVTDVFRKRPFQWRRKASPHWAGLGTLGARFIQRGVALSEIEAEHQEFPMYARCSSSRILRNHWEDLFPNLPRRRSPPHLPPGPSVPHRSRTMSTPEEALWGGCI
jgi:hypothetical protein